MSEPRPLPPRPDLRRLRDEAKARRRAGEFPTLALAQLAIAREHGFASWPRLKIQVEAVTLDAAERAGGLVRSALSADTRRAKALLAADPALSGRDMACACVSGNAQALSRLLARDPSAASTPTGPLDHAPIIYATFTRLLRDPDRAPGIREVARLLLEAGADPDASFMHGDWLQVPLYGAAGIAGDPELTRMLIEAGADPNDASPAHTVGEALYHACERADPTCARLLIEAGTDPSVVDHCLGRALNFDHPEMIEAFCAGGARPHAGHLHQALWRRRPRRTIAALLDAGAPLEQRDEDGLTPLQIAVRWGDRAAAAVLLDRGADAASARDEDRTLGAFLAADAVPPPAPRGDSLKLLDAMVITAIQGGHLEAVRRLLDAGARVDGDPESEDHPLGQACWRGRVEIVAELLSHGARTEFEAGGSAIGAALHGSRHCNHPEGGPTMQPREEIPTEPYARIVRMLLAAGAAVPEKIGDSRARPGTLIAELGLDPPA